MKKNEEKKPNITMDELVNYCKNYGYIFQGSEIYNGLSNTWDYGPLGTNLKENIRNAWKKVETATIPTL